MRPNLHNHLREVQNSGFLDVKGREDGGMFLSNPSPTVNSSDEKHVSMQDEAGAISLKTEATMQAGARWSRSGHAAPSVTTPFHIVLVRWPCRSCDFDEHQRVF